MGFWVCMQTRVSPADVGEANPSTSRQQQQQSQQSTNMYGRIPSQGHEDLAVANLVQAQQVCFALLHGSSALLPFRVSAAVSVGTTGMLRFSGLLLYSLTEFLLYPPFESSAILFSWLSCFIQCVAIRINSDSGSTSTVAAVR